MLFLCVRQQQRRTLKTRSLLTLVGLFPSEFFPRLVSFAETNVLSGVFLLSLGIEIDGTSCCNSAKLI